MSKTYEQIKEEMNRKRSVKHWSKKDIKMIKDAQKTGDYTEVYQSKLYNKYSGEYCTLLEVLM
jgi:hypothetical protein